MCVWDHNIYVVFNIYFMGAFPYGTFWETLKDLFVLKKIILSCIVLIVANSVSEECAWAPDSSVKRQVLGMIFDWA